MKYNNDYEDESSVDVELSDTQEFTGKTITVEITAGAILGALSILLGFIWDAYVESVILGPQFAPGMTWFDVLSVPIIVAFLVFGIRSGLIAAVIGCGVIPFYLSESLGWLAMIPKLFSTLIMILVPWLAFKLWQSRTKNKKDQAVQSYASDFFKEPVKYIIVFLVTIASRSILMFVLNSFFVGPMYIWLLYSPAGTPLASIYSQPLTLVTLGGGYALWNLVQGFSDALLAFLIVYPTRLYKFASW